jgi:hypothetical protein
LSIDPTGGTCNKTVAPNVDVERITSCAASAGGGCPEGTACVHPAEPHRTVCVYQEGLIEDCPGLFPARHLLLANATDLSCGPADCDCGVAAGGICSGSVNLLSSGCTSAIAGVADTGCTTFGSSVSFSTAKLNASASGGTCGPIIHTDATRFGDVTTLCCQDGL